jgi:hypothetical protein
MGRRQRPKFSRFAPTPTTGHRRLDPPYKYYTSSMAEHNSTAAWLQHIYLSTGIYIMKTEVIILLNNGFPCPLPFLNSIKQEVDFITPAVPEDALLITEQLCGEEFWTPLSDWERTLAGSCMDHLAEHGHVPFENVPRTGRNPYPLQFRIKA